MATKKTPKSSVVKAAKATASRKIGLSINPALMRSDITFLANMSDQQTRTPTGSLNTTTEWVPAATTRAYATIVSGTEFFQLLQAGHRVDARFIMRWLEFTLPSTVITTTPTTAMWVTWNNDTYRIKSVDDPDDLHVELQIDAEAIGKERDVI
jgi:hypothetical protein